MPIIERSSYRAPWYLFNRHLETIVPSLTRKVNGVHYQRSRLELSDGDFVDLDWLKGDNRREKLAIISHGLEGNSTRHYTLGAAKYFYEHNWDSLAWNCRSCGGELNRLARFYHHGDTADLGFVVDEALRLGYRTIVLIGFSMGGSFALKYLGEKGSMVAKEVKASVLFSVPCDLAVGGRVLDGPGNGFYRRRFIGKLRRKLIEKSKRFPKDIDTSRINSVTTFDDFNNCYTAPLHGFRNSDDFYSKSSCLPYLSDIRIPTLLVNAANDPLLGPECYPVSVAEKSDYVYLEIPPRGGHVGFALSNSEENWMEVRAFEFITDVMDV